MFTLECKVKCVACSNIIEDWATRDTPHKWRFFSKCNSCGVVNLFDAPRNLSLEEVIIYTTPLSPIKATLSESEVDRLRRIKVRYEIPDHIPIAQFEKYKQKKVQERCQPLEKLRR